MSLARWRRPDEIGSRDRPPVRLLQVLAGVLGLRVIAPMHIDGDGPVIAGPRNFAASGYCSDARSTGTCEEIDDAHSSLVPTSS